MTAPVAPKGLGGEFSTTARLVCARGNAPAWNGVRVASINCGNPAMFRDSAAGPALRHAAAPGTLNKRRPIMFNFANLDQRTRSLMIDAIEEARRSGQMLYSPRLNDAGLMQWAD